MYSLSKRQGIVMGGDGDGCGCGCGALTSGVLLVCATLRTGRLPYLMKRSYKENKSWN